MVSRSLVYYSVHSEILSHQMEERDLVLWLNLLFYRAYIVSPCTDNFAETFEALLAITHV